jgi:predicted ATPase
MLGLTGAHRTGKSTLCQAVSERFGVPFVKTDTVGVYQKLGMSPNDPMDVNTRLTVQEKIADAMIETFSGASGIFITDRTPIDMMAYLLLNLPQELDDLQTQRVKRYIERCRQACINHFDVLIRIQPGIPIVAAEGKARPSPTYIETLNAMMGGLMLDLIGNGPQLLSLPRETLDLQARVNYMSDILQVARYRRATLDFHRALH